MTRNRGAGLPGGIRRAFRLAIERPRIESDVSDEVAFHLDMRVSELVAQGWDEAAAREEARRRFGDIQRWSNAMATVDRQRVTGKQWGEWFGDLARDLRYTARALRREPLFTAGVVGTLALGIGANATMFGIVDQLLLRPPAHVVEPSAIRRFYTANRDDLGVEHHDPGFGYAAFASLRATSQSFVDLAAWSGPSTQALGRGTDAREVLVGDATASLFPTLGARPVLGRFFTEAEDSPPTGTAVAVLGHELWRTAFAGDPRVLGRSITIGGREFEVVGVAPPGFTGIELQRVDVWIPMTTASAGPISRMARPGTPWWQLRSVEWLELLGRLKPGVTTAQAEAELGVLYQRFMTGGPEAASPRPGVEPPRPRILLAPVHQERGPERSPSARITMWLMGVSAFVLIIACANVTNLLLARAARRKREIAIRLAIGSGRGRLVRQLLLESLVLTAAGGIAGLLVAQWGGSFVRAVLLPSVAWGRTLTDPRVLLFTFVVVAVSGILAGIVPALQASRPDLTDALKSGRREGHGRQARTRTALLVTQSALSVVLLVGAGLFVRSLDVASRAPLGFQPNDLLHLGSNLRGAGYSATETAALYQQIRERVQQLPGVTSAALVASVPFWSRFSTDLRIPGLDSLPRMAGGRPTYSAVSPDYFTTVGTRLLRGRDFTEADRQGSTLVAIVSETTARTLWPGGDALGQCVRLGFADSLPCTTVVGIAEDVRWDALREKPRLHVYAAFAQRGDPPSLLVRARADDSATIEAIRRVVYAIAPRVTFARLVPVSSYVDRQLRPWQLGASMFTVFGVLALVIAAMGLYSMLAYAVTLRTHEMGVRMALGARMGDVLRLVVSDGLRVTLIGVVIGLIAAALLAPLLQALLFDGVKSRDPLVMAGVAMALVTVALLASLAPALRAARADPNAALRSD